MNITRTISNIFLLVALGYTGYAGTVRHGGIVYDAERDLLREILSEPATLPNTSILLHIQWVKRSQLEALVKGDDEYQKQWSPAFGHTVQPGVSELFIFKNGNVTWHEFHEMTSTRQWIGLLDDTTCREVYHRFTQGLRQRMPTGTVTADSVRIRCVYLSTKGVLQDQFYLADMSQINALLTEIRSKGLTVTTASTEDYKAFQARPTQPWVNEMLAQ